jgi:hypothetical protein
MPETIEVGELLYEVTLQITSNEDFGIGMEAILGGEAIPPAGARFDVVVEGESTGKIAGIVKAVDYILMRADGRMQLHIHGSMETPDGARIAISAVGTSEPNEATGLSELRENVELHTASPQFAWVNTISVWGKGTVNLATGQLIIKGYAA